MKKAKKWISILLILSLLFSLFEGLSLTSGAADEDSTVQYVPGDINGDGSVDILDANALLQYSILPEFYPISYPGVIDLNHDDSIDINDALQLLQYSILPQYYDLETWPEKSGTCGDGLTWYVDEDTTSVLTITGEGAMTDVYEIADYVPWFAFRKKITEVTVEEGVAGLSSNCLSLCENLSGVTILNPECAIPNEADALGSAENTTVYGYAGSTAESYAQTWDYTFVPLTPAGFYTVTFDSQGGTEVPSQLVEAGSCAEYPVEPFLEGALFIAWNSDPECQQPFDFETPITEDITLYAQWDDHMISAGENGVQVYTITSLSVDTTTNTAEATVSAPGDCQLLVRFMDEEVYFSEDYPENKVYLAETTLYARRSIPAGTNEELISADILGRLPENFVAEAILLDGEGNPLTNPFSNIEHTQRYDLFIEKTIYDFEGETVLNFDENEDNNFGVLSQDVVSLTAESGTLDEETGAYYFTGLSEEVFPGEKVYIQAGEDQFLFCVKSISIEDDVVEIYPATNDDSEYGFDLKDFYTYLKVDMTYDVSDLDESSQGEEVQRLEIDPSLKAAFSGKITIGKNLQITAEISGEVKIAIQWDIHIFGEDYFGIEFSASLKGELSVFGGFEKEDNADRLRYLLFKMILPTTIPGLHGFIETRVKAEYKISGGLTLQGNLSYKVGFTYNTKDKWQKISTANANWNINAKMSGSLTAGLELAPGIEFLNGLLRSNILGFVGPEIEGKIEAEVGVDEKSKHGCFTCVDGSLKLLLEASASLSAEFASKKHEYEITLAGFEMPLASFFFSIANPKDSLYGGKPHFGWGDCENKAYKTNFVGYNNAPITETIAITPERTGEKITIKGTESIFLYPDNYTAEVRINGMTTSTDFTVTDKAQTIVLASSYGIHFDGNGANLSTSMSDQIVACGETVNLNPCTYFRADYVFDGWNTKSDGSGTSYADKASIKDIAAAGGRIVLFAQWKKAEFVIHFDGNGENLSSSMSDQTVSRNYTVNLNRCTFFKTGYTFDGWNTKADGSGTAYADEAPVKNIAATGERIVLFAQWKINTYKVTYYANNGGSGVNSQNAEYGARITLYSNPFIYSGKVFTGWNTRADGKGTPYEAGAEMPLYGDLTLYAQWKDAIYKIIFDGNNESPSTSMSNQDAARDQNVTLNRCSYGRTGHNFSGWNTERDGSGTSYADQASVYNLAPADGYVTLYAQWTPIEYQVTYHANNGSSTASSQSAAFGSKITLRSNSFTYSGKVFTGWNTRADGSGTAYAAGASVTVSGDLTLYAQWKDATYVIHFDGNGENSSSSMSDQTIWYGQTTDLNRCTYFRTGYTFTGWNTKADGSGTSYADAVPVKDLAEIGERIVLFAQWKINTYQITYNKNGGSGTVSSQSTTYGSKITLRSNSFTYTGKAFTGWNTKADGSGTAYAAAASVTLYNNLTLYAQWKDATYVIHFDGNGENASSSMSDQTVLSGEYVKLNRCTYFRTGYTFDGWNTKADGSGIDYKDEESIKDLTAAGERIVLFAQWKINTYQITYNANGGSGTVSSQSTSYGSQLTLRSNSFTYTGKAFTGWNTKADGSGTAYAAAASVTLYNNLTLYAQWKDATYRIIFNGNGESASTSMSNQTAARDQYVTLNRCTYGRTGYAFRGWNTKADGSGTSYADQASVRNLAATDGYITLYAQWEHTAHTYSAWDYNTGSHWKTCTECGYKQSESHSFTLVSTSSGHYSKCATCGYTSATTAHTYGAWSYTSSTHSRTCTACGYVNSGSHSLSAWGTSTGSHWRSCTCGYEEQGNHSFTIVSTSSGHYSKCSTCGYTTSTSAHTLEYEQVSSGHRQKCKYCDYVSSTASHTYSAWDYNTGSHYRTCSACGYKQSESHSFTIVSTSSGHYSKCATCGYTTTSSSHTYSYVSSGSTGHYQKCSFCGYTTSTVSHSLSYVSSGSSGHYRKCSTCGYTTSTTSHSLSYVKNGTSGHYQKCSSCGYTTSTVSHSYGSWASNGSSTHTRSCTVCGYTASASHSLSYVKNGSSGHYRKCATCGYTTSTVSHTFPSTWTSNGSSTHKKTCTACSYITTASHTFPSTWSKDATYHWKTCTASGCGYQNKASHTWKYVGSSKQCTVCLYG